MSKSEQTQRLFICFELPQQVKKMVAECQSNLRHVPVKVAWTRVENLHLTLKFLGDTKESFINKIENELQVIARGIGPIELVFDKLGAFPNLRQPRILWMGCSVIPANLAELAQQINQQLAVYGFSIEKKLFQPHLTLGRVKGGNLQMLREELAGFHVQKITFKARHLTLMRSELKASGAIYNSLAHIALKFKTVGE
ncbi:MAG: RNA 2',3'-cyclic phosphodiesterase [Calditrichaeota bacterium]|nr:MAG: RNA 2',3'-cyclic phosphodiesterase [Calditrichota bacterium]